MVVVCIMNLNLRKALVPRTLFLAWNEVIVIPSAACRLTSVHYGAYSLGLVGASVLGLIELTTHYIILSQKLLLCRGYTVHSS